MKPIKRKITKKLAKKIKKWIASKKGKREIKEALEKARRLSEQFREASKVDWKSLHEPCGPADGTGDWSTIKY